VNALIREALFRVQGFHRVMDETGGTSAVYVLADNWRDEVATADLSRDQAASLAYFKDPCSLDQICDRATSLQDFDACRLVWVLLTIGALKRIE
jgi:hypothetical protein